MQLPEQIESERIILKHPLKPTFKLAEELYAIVDKSRNTLREWLPWVDKTNSVEDEFTGFLVGSCQKNWEEGCGFAYILYQKETNQILGIVDLFQINEKNQSAEIGFWLSDSATGHGYMQEAVLALESEGFKAGLNRIIIRNDTLNMRSAHVAERCGYVLEGVMRQDIWDDYHQHLRDTNIWSKLKSEWEEEQK